MKLMNDDRRDDNYKPKRRAHTRVYLRPRHSEFFAKNRVSGKYGEIQSNTVKHKNRKTEKQRKPEYSGGEVLLHVGVTGFKWENLFPCIIQ